VPAACYTSHTPLACCPQDDALDDAELNAFQVRCFNAPLQPEELMGVKKVVQDKMPQVWVNYTHPALRLHTWCFNPADGY
jgi:hypothetical protein